MDVFSFSNIKEISIPSGVTKIYLSTFMHCKNLIKVTSSNNSNLQTINAYAFSGSAYNSISIPPSLTRICRKAFSECAEFKIIEISEESKLQSIHKSAFADCPKLINKLIQRINNL